MTKKELFSFIDSLYDLCLEAEKEEEIPVSALLVLKDGRTFSSYNHVEKENDPFSHAEYNVISQVLKDEKTRYLKGSTLFVSLEPCLFCMGAILKSGIENLYYVLDDKKAGSLSYYHTFVDDRLRVHQIDDERFEELMDRFFKKLR